MGISIRRDLNTRVDLASRNYAVKSSPEEIKNTAGKYDSLSLSQGKSLPSDSDFARLLSKEMIKSMQRGADRSRVSELHDMVQSGSYRPSASRIAEKLLGYRD